MRALVSENQQYDYAKPKAQISYMYEVTAQLISTVVFVTRILHFLSYLNPKFKDNPAYVAVQSGLSDLVRNPDCWFSHAEAHSKLKFLPRGFKARSDKSSKHHEYINKIK